MNRHIHCSKCHDSMQRLDGVFFNHWDVVLCKECAKDVLQDLNLQSEQFGLSKTEKQDMFYPAWGCCDSCSERKQLIYDTDESNPDYLSEVLKRKPQPKD